MPEGNLSPTLSTENGLSSEQYIKGKFVACFLRFVEYIDVIVVQVSENEISCIKLMLIF